MNKKYIIVLKSQLGPKTGTLRIRESGEHLWGVLELLGHKSLLTGKTVIEGQDLEFNGKIRTPLGFTACLLSVIKKENEFTGELRIDNKYYEISGKR